MRSPVLSYRHPERSRGIFFVVAVLCTYEVMIKSPRCFGCSSSDALRLAVVQGRFLALLEMTIRGESGILVSQPSPLGKGGTAPAVDRVLSLTAHLRCFSLLFFMPLGPYPARFARSLPHWGKAYDTGSAFLSFVFMPPGAFASCYPTVPFSRVQGRFLASLEMTIRGKAVFSFC